MNRQIIIIFITLLSVFVFYGCADKQFYSYVGKQNADNMNCPENKGYKALNDRICYNSATRLSYFVANELGERFFSKNNVQCGVNCDYDGRNCSRGICSLEDCAKDKGYTELILEEKNQRGFCYAPKIGLSYTIYDKIKYYDRNGVSCGKNCDYDGRNCSEGNCYIDDCARDKGYTELKDTFCYNPTTGLSYDLQNGYYYKNGHMCGTNCDYDGRNCNKGICNIEDCVEEKGYRLQDDLCYNLSLGLSYDLQNGYYYKNGHRCGIDCDFNARNCKWGFCNVEECAKDKGYTELKIDGKTNGGYCHNPDKELSYSSRKDYYRNGKYCGNKCDYNGRNCSEGICYIEDCARDKGYTELKNSKCYNPNTGFAYTEEIQSSGENAGRKIYIFDYYSGNVRAESFDMFSCNDINLKECSYYMNLILKHGYTSVVEAETPGSFGIWKMNILYNNKTNLSVYRDSYGDNIYLYQGAICGKNCNPDGRNCKEGICSIADCRLAGMTKMVFVEKTHDVHGGICPNRLIPQCTYKMRHAACSK